MDFKNKTVLITGAGAGIGRASAVLFGAKGANLILVGRNEKALRETENLVLKESAKTVVQLVTADLSKVSEVDRLFQTAKPFDIAVNNAGIEGKIADITKLSAADFDQVMDVNVRGLFLCCKHQVAHFQSQNKPGNIVNLSSIAGVIGIPTSSLYVASKHAVIGLTKSLALEQIKNNIRINCVCPGGVETPMLDRIYKGHLDQAAARHPIGRIATPQEIANAIAWLASPDSSFVVGHSLIIDGGRTAE